MVGQGSSSSSARSNRSAPYQRRSPTKIGYSPLRKRKKVVSDLHEITIDSAPSNDPVTLSEAKDYLGYTDSDQDTLITNLITSATKLLERWTNRAFVTQTLKAYYSRVKRKTYLPRSPVQSVDNVDRIRQDETTTLTQGTDYYVQGLDQKYIIIPKPWDLAAGHSPLDNLGNFELEVKYTAGFGARSDVPEPIKEAIKKTVNTMFDMRHNMSQSDEAGQNELIPAAARHEMMAYAVL